MKEDAALFQTEDLRKIFPLRGSLRGTRKSVQAVDGVGLTLNRGEILGVAGESGSGKSTLARLLLGLEKPTEGYILFEGKGLTQFSSQEWKAFRKRVQPIFQDPFSSLNPKMRVGEMVGEGLWIHRLIPRRDIPKRVEMLLEQVGLEAKHAFRYPHEFSGGQRQRIGIARALAVEPEVLICDEPVSSLDLSVQAQILNLLMRLQKEKNLTYLFITHNLSILESLADRIMVMVSGKVVELAETEALFATPRHPYTKRLLEAMPRFGKP